MQALLRLSALIDALNGWVGRAVSWLILAMVLISAGNAVVRKVLDVSSNAWLELQWQLFRRRLHAGRRVDPPRQRAHPHRHRELAPAEGGARLDRPARPRPLPDAVRPHHALGRRAVLPPLDRHRRAVAQRRRAAAVAGQAAGPARLLPSLRPGRVGDHQAGRGHARPHSGPARGLRHGSRAPRPATRPSSSRRSAALGLLRPQHGPDHVRVARAVPYPGLPGRLRARRQRPVLRPDRRRPRPVPARLPPGPA